MTGIEAAIKNYIEKDDKEALKYVVDKAKEQGYNTLLALFVIGINSSSMNGGLEANMEMTLSGGGQPWTMSAYLEHDPKGRDASFLLDQYANESWETILHYMVASSLQGGISADAVRTLLQAGLMCQDKPVRYVIIYLH